LWDDDLVFDVFVEGPVDPSPGAVRKLAETIAAKYGLSAEDFATRLARGRVRVKAKVDRNTADAYVKSLAKIGAQCSVEEARGGDASAPIHRAATPPAGLPITRTPPSGVPTERHLGLRTATPPAGTRTATPPAGVPLRAQTPATGVPMTRSPLASRSEHTQTPGRGVATARPNVPRSATLSDAPLRPPAPYVAARFKTPSTQPDGLAEERAQSQPIASGLAAATTAPIDTNLGALEHADASALTLSSLDGHAEMAMAPESSGSFGPSVELDNGPYATAPSSPAPAAAKSNEPLDLFAPMEDGADFKVEVAPEDDFARKKPPPPREDTPVPARAPTPILLAAQAAMPAKRGKLGPLADVKVRFAAGVVAAVLLGFIPATIVASIRERSAYHSIDEQYLKEAETSQDPDLDAKYLDKKRSERRGIAFTSMLIWALAGGGVAYVWFRRVPWERWA
jgi:hypothetical protein